MAYGTLSTLDTLASIRQSVVEFGEDSAWASIQAALDAHNRQVQNMMGSLVERSTDVRRAYGTSDTGVMDEMDQWGSPDAQKITAGVAVDFPLRRYGASKQWTLQWMRSNTVAQLAAEVSALMDADRLNMQRQVKRAVYLPTNTTFVDKLGTGANGYPAGITLNIKAFVNNDGANLPVGPNGEVFATSHTHYLGASSLTATAVQSLVTTVQEHYNSGSPKLYISQTDEAAFRALTGFVAYLDPRLTINANTNQATVRLDLANLYDRAIGLFGAAEVWIKPWAIANYIFCFIDGQPVPLVMRVPMFEGLSDLQPVYEDERYPLHARTWERQFGISVWNRTNGGVLYFANSTYAAPTI